MDIKIKNKRNWNGDGIYVGRPSPLSNPFRITENCSREEAIDRYELWLMEAILNEGVGSIDHVQVITALQNIESYLIEHGECNLICYCSPKPCHADIIKQVLLNKFHTNEWLVNGKVGIL